MTGEWLWKIAALKPRNRRAEGDKSRAVQGGSLRAMAMATVLLFAGGPYPANAIQAPPSPAGSQADRDAEVARLAAEALAAGHPAEAAGILETIVAPRHHMLAILPEWHRDLGRAYAALGLVDGAEGQYLLALAGVPDDEAGAFGKALSAPAAKDREATIVPDTLGPNGAKYFDLHWVDRRDGIIDFAAIFVLPQDAVDGEAL